MMPKPKQPAAYQQQAIPTSIRATSRVSVKLAGDTFYTFEYTEERFFPVDLMDEGLIDIEMEREMLWSTAHGEVDKQVADAVEATKTRK